ncbi:MAG: hypothetical protein DI629_01260 [Mesorhizobium amorphae]|nr:MAG: hypothetical protein DI629_01260 [Mesorhizobium amorphae]
MTDTAEHASPSSAERRTGFGAVHHPDAAAPAWVWAVILAMLAAMAGWLVGLDWRAQWPAGLLVLVTMATVTLPTATRKRHPFVLPVPIELAIALFVFGSLFLGEILGWYDRIWWWDLLLHSSSGVLLSALGLLFAYGIGGKSLNARVAFLFAPMLAMSVGTVWEFFEFAIENLFGVAMQTPQVSGGSGLVDTMWDLIVNAVAAVGVALYGWHYTRPSRGRGIPRWVEGFLDRNAAFFERRRAR